MLRKSRLGQKNGFPIKKKGVVKSRQNGIFHFVKTTRLHENGSSHPDEISLR